ncbi:hypothetical protein BJ878DRAFT_23762, partial [Calycina marina]
MDTDQQGQGSQQPSTPNERPNPDIPPWLVAFMRNQQETNARLEQGLTQLHQSMATNSTSSNNATPDTTYVQDNTHIEQVKKPKHSLPTPGHFTGENESTFPQFKGLLEAKLEIDSHAIGSERERVWYAFGRLEGQAAGRIYP